MHGFIARVRSLLKSLRSSDRLEREMDEEMQLHIDLHAERLMKERGLDRATAMRTAKMDFGSMDNYKEAGRDVRGLNRVSGLALDFKLGMRMLWKYPGLTIAGTLTIAVAVALAASWFQFMTDTSRPNLGLDESNRVLMLRNVDVATGKPDDRTLGEFVKWRTELTSVTDLTAAREGSFNLSTDNRAATTQGAWMSAAGFALARVRPIAGRAIIDADETAAAPAVVVLGYQLWQQLFDGNRSAIGSTIRVDGTPTTIVGVMPKGFGYPVNASMWLPLKTTGVASGGEPTGPVVMLTGRLAHGRTLRQAQSELNVIAARSNAALPSTNEHKYRPKVQKFGSTGSMGTALALLNIPFILFLLVVCANVGTLVYARTATRESEIAVRSVLGASRKRIVMQLFFEALVLTTGGAALGLASAAFVWPRSMSLFWEVQQSAPPFWFTGRLGTATVAYTFALAVLAALVIGGLPALKATGKDLRNRIAQPGSGGSGMRFGKVSTVVVTTQVALCVAFLPIAIETARAAIVTDGNEPGAFPSDQFVTARIVIPPQTALNATSTDIVEKLRNRIAAEPGVTGVAFADRLPGFNQLGVGLTIDGDTAQHDELRVVRTDADFIKLMGARIIAGRGFTAADAKGPGNIAIVDSLYAAKNFPRKNAVGMRVKFEAGGTDANNVSYEIMGVVAGMTPAIGSGSTVSMYEPMTRDSTAQVYIRTTGSAPQLAPHIQEIVVGTDPSVMAADAMTLTNAWRPVYRSSTYLAMGISLMAGIILTFALIGIYALMSFTVSQRTREIGIRSALGADQRRIIVSIFSRAMMQIGTGVLVGAGLVSATILKSPEDLRLVAQVAALMVGCGLIGCVMPARRALRIHPTQALRAE
jgi:predicted permease